jgi:transketolase
VPTGFAAYAPGFIPYCATFLIFTDYMRAAMRVCALSELRHLFVMTHDSIGLGEDGPTHQPIEHFASFRAMPNIYTWRPCGGNETAAAYKFAVEKKTAPSLMCFSRQGMPNYEGCTREGALKGGYVVDDCEGTPSHILMGTGSELTLCMDAAAKLKEEGVAVRVVSMPCTELFDEQSDEYKESVLPEAVGKRVAVEAGVSMGWSKYIGPRGKYMGVEKFGSSAPGPEIYEHLGMTPDHLVAMAKSL